MHSEYDDTLLVDNFDLNIQPYQYEPIVGQEEENLASATDLDDESDNDFDTNMVADKPDVVNIERITQTNEFGHCLVSNAYQNHNIKQYLSITHLFYV